MFVFDAEEGPHAATADFGEADEEAEEGGMLEFVGVDGIEDPVEAEDGVEDHGKVVDPGAFVAELVTEEGIFGIWVEETCVCQQFTTLMEMLSLTPVHCNIPDG